MRFVIFCHSLRSCWNHGNAHFLRGICTELIARGHDVRVYEPSDAWSVQNLVADHGEEAVDAYREAYPHLTSIPIDYQETLSEDVPVVAQASSLYPVAKASDVVAQASSLYQGASAPNEVAQASVAQASSLYPGVKASDVVAQASSLYPGANALDEGSQASVAQASSLYQGASAPNEQAQTAQRDERAKSEGNRLEACATTGEPSCKLDALLESADVVIVHEWNEPELVKAIGEHHKRNPGYRLLFHDTHHRAATEPEAMARYDLSGYDGVLAFGAVIRDLYLKNGWCKQAWVWHEAADPQVFRQRDFDGFDGDLVWVGNWGDEERTAELHEFLIEPVRELGLKAKVYGVRYPDHAKKALQKAGIEYGGWLPNHRAPEVFARYRMTVHVPRRPYVQALPGIPTIRVFEALSCRIPLICAPWSDAEQLFCEGHDYLAARDGEEMRKQMRWILENPALAACIALQGHKTLMARHTCAHRVDELEEILGIRTKTPYRSGAVAI